MIKCIYTKDEKYVECETCDGLDKDCEFYDDGFEFYGFYRQS